MSDARLGAESTAVIQNDADYVPAATALRGYTTCTHNEGWQNTFSSTTNFPMAQSSLKNY